MDIIPITKSIELPEIDEDPQAEEDWADFINIFYFHSLECFKSDQIILPLIRIKNLKSTSDFQKSLVSHEEN